MTEEINEEDLIDLKICDGRVTEKPTTEEDIVNWLRGKNEKN